MKENFFSENIVHKVLLSNFFDLCGVQVTWKERLVEQYICNLY